MQSTLLLLLQQALGTLICQQQESSEKRKPESSVTMFCTSSESQINEFSQLSSASTASANTAAYVPPIQHPYRVGSSDTSSISTGSFHHELTRGSSNESSRTGSVDLTHSSTNSRTHTQPEDMEICNLQSGFGEVKFSSVGEHRRRGSTRSCSSSDDGASSQKIKKIWQPFNDD